MGFNSFLPLLMRLFIPHDSSLSGSFVSRTDISTKARHAPRFSKGFSKDEQEEAFFDTASASVLHTSTKSARLSSSSSLHVFGPRGATEGEWLQETADDTDIDASQVPTARFDWRGRASSRARKSPKALVEVTRFKKRIHPPVPAVKNELTPAIERYSTKFLKLLALEEAEDEAALKHRLATWPIERLQTEGFCLTGLSAYWLEATQYGRPVANFALGPGNKLPENKLETGCQVLLSRLDPLKEEPMKGAVVSQSASSIRVTFASSFYLDDAVWRLDLGRPNLMYERMRTAIGHLEHVPKEIEKAIPEKPTAQEFILQGTDLRDVLLKSFNEVNPPEEEISTLDFIDNLVDSAAESALKASASSFQHNGIFREDQRIQSWARRYSRPNPVVVEGDPPVDDLNVSQLRAMAAMIGERISLIQGPPGTGKTKTIIETIKLLKVHFEVPQPIVVCTYTNVAVDNLVEGFLKAGVKPLRVGHHGSLRESVISSSLDYKLLQHPLNDTLAELVAKEKDMATETTNLAKEISTLEEKVYDPTKKSKKTLLQRMTNMKVGLVKLQLRHKFTRSRIYAVQQKMLRDVIADADVICTTCITAACHALGVADFPVVFIDEASMSTEPASLIPLMKGSQHVALIGDHKQLPPVIVSREAKKQGFSVSLFERLIEEGHVPSVMLDIQYRMHPAISRFPAKEFYDLALLDGTVDAGGNALPGLEPPSSKHTRHDTGKGRPSVIFLDHTGDESYKGRSFENVSEARIVASVVEDLLLNNEQLQGSDIGIIAPYIAQIKLLERLFRTDPSYIERFRSVLGPQRAQQAMHVEIKTVDGFEGREKQVIIFSTVRNNPEGYIGFLADKKRLNVGLTRAKRGLFVVGSISTLRAGGARNAAAARYQAQQALVTSQLEESKEGTSEVDSPNKVKAKAKTKTKEKQAASSSKASKGADSWARYAQYLEESNLVVRLTGAALLRSLNDHSDAASKRQQVASRL